VGVGAGVSVGVLVGVDVGGSMVFVGVASGVSVGSACTAAVGEGGTGVGVGLRTEQAKLVRIARRMSRVVSRRDCFIGYLHKVRYTFAAFLPLQITLVP
jgi:hypothetical protein